MGTVRFFFALSILLPLSWDAEKNQITRIIGCLWWIFSMTFHSLNLMAATTDFWLGGSISLIIIGIAMQSIKEWDGGLILPVQSLIKRFLLFERSICWPH